MKDLYLGGPQIDASFCFLQPDAATNFASVCRALSGLGATPGGLADLVRTSVQPAFGMLPDLPVESLEVDMSSGTGQRIFEDLVGGKSPDEWVLGAGYAHPDAGKIVVKYGMTSGAEPIGRHPISASVSGESFATSELEELSTAERAAAWKITSPVQP